MKTNQSLGGNKFMKLALLGRWGLGALMLAGSGICSATVLFSNFASSPLYDLNTGNTVGNGFDGNNYAEGETFTPTADAIFTSVQIGLGCAFTCSDSYVVALTADNKDAPGSVIESFTLDGTLLPVFGGNATPVTVNSILNPTLSSGTFYWITVATDLNNSMAWNLNTTGDSNDQAQSSDGGSTWFSPSGNTPGAFEVDGTLAGVPEPGSALLIGAGLLATYALGRRRSRLN
jgi:PEP-CTERM motif